MFNNFFSQKPNATQGVEDMFIKAVLNQLAADGEFELEADVEADVEADTAPIGSTVETNITNVVIEGPDGTITVEQTSTVVTTVTVQERPKETIYQVDVTVMDIPAMRHLLQEAIAEACRQNYMNCKAVSVDPPFASLRFTSPLYSSIAKIANMSGGGEDNITSFER